MIRDVETSDAGAIAEIYRYYVEETAISFETVAPSAEEMKNRITEFAQKFAWIVYEEDGRVVGYAYASPFRAREAYRYTVTISIYMNKDICGRGYGRKLLERLLAMLASGDFYTAVACITEPNDKSRNLFASVGFEHMGTYRNVGYKNDKWYSVMEFVKPLKEYMQQND